MFGDKIMESCSTTGTGAFSLAGAVGAYVTWRSRFATAAVVFYFATNAAGTKWEAGYGTLTYGAPDTLSRTLLSSSTGALINWQAADAPFYVYSMPSAVALQHLISGNRQTARPGWLQRGGLWMDESDAGAWSTTRAIDKMYNGTTDVETGRYEAVEGIYVPNPRWPYSAKGAANYTVTANDVGRRFSLDNTAAQRTLTLPAISAVSMGFVFEFRGLSLANYIALTPAGSDVIDYGSAGAVLYVPGRCPIQVWSDGTQWRTSFCYSNQRILLQASPSAVATLDFTLLPSWVNSVRIEGEVLLATNADQLAMRVYNSSGVLQSAGTDYTYMYQAVNSTPTGASNGTTTSYMLIAAAVSNSANVGIGFDFRCTMRGQGRYAKCTWTSEYMDSGGTLLVGEIGWGFRNAADSPSGFRLLTTGGGNFTGKVNLIGNA